MIMEYLEGQDLDALVAHRVDVFVTVGYVLQACEAVAEAHSVGIVHRDLKPRNLFLTRRIDGTPLVKVLDFGIAKRVSGEPQAAALTGTLSIVGSPPYMSPEQMRASRDLDERSDIWSLGVCLYELTTGVLPFDGETAVDVCAAALKHDPRRPDELSEEVPRALADVVMRCLRKDPEDRFPDVGALAEALEAFAPSSERGAAARIRHVLRAPEDPWATAEPRPVLELAPSDTRTAAAVDSRSARKRRSRGTWLSVAAVAIAVSGTLWLGQRMTRPALPAASTASVRTSEAAVVQAVSPPAPDPTTSSRELELPPREVRSPRRPSAARSATADVPPAPAPPPSSPPAQDPTPSATAVTVAVAPAPLPPAFVTDTARVQIGSAMGTVGTTPSNVNRVFAGLRGRITACYRDSLPRMSAPFDGAGTLHVETDEEGVIIDARLRGPLAGAVGSCVVATVRGQRVPNADTGRVRADIPLTFLAR